MRWAVFVPDYTRKCGVGPQDKNSAFMKVPAAFDYNKIFCLKEIRTVQNGYTISYKEEKIQLEDNGLYAGRKVEVRVWPGASVHV